MLKRKFYNKLLDWKKKANKKPLFVRGARQIGKTYIIDYFGKTNYSSYIYINFLENSEYKRIFDGALNAATIYSRMSLMIQSARFTENDTLIFLDEIQECGNARTALKFLAQDARYDIVVSGSLLGVQYKNVKSIPVGYEEPVTMHSLDFEEFLWAKGYSQEQISALQESFLEQRKVDDLINDVMHKELREYMVIGGMPAVVQQFIEKRNFAEADEIQRQIVSDYLDDIMNYASDVEKPKIRNCFLSIPRQLARENENRKFKYAEVEKGVGARKFINSVEWLRDASMAEMAHNLTAPLFPLSAYEDESAFKLYLSDIGLLSSLYGFETKAAIINQTIRGSVKGALYENLIATGLVRRGYALRYLQDRRIPMEVEFLLEKDGKVVPLEVKASNASTASLNRLLEREDIEFGYKFTSGNVGVAGKKITLPHYMMMFI
ncbi:MAG: ATP-binding protein [Kiritimatiellae bacterium]|nr:ATP-binding protein [Kiritimatiellia bacterium]